MTDSLQRHREADRKAKRAALARRRAAGQRQAVLFFEEEDLAFLDEIKVTTGSKSRSEAMAALLAKVRDLAPQFDQQQENGVPG